VVFAHQSRWQQKMLLRYGCEVCLIDATHNTTAYGLHLFQLCMPTNCGYVTAATLLLTDEQADTIEQGLRKVAEWCIQDAVNAAVQNASVDYRCSELG